MSEQRKVKMKWYALHTYSGHENKVKEKLEEMKEEGEKIGEILIPTEDVIKVSKGKKTLRSKKVLPGYLFIELRLDKALLRKIRQIPQVTDFLGHNKIPHPIPESEIQHLKGQVAGEGKPKIVHEFKKNDNVRVIEGPFMNFTGVVESVNPEKGKLKAMVSILGRVTPVELEFEQVEKL